MNRAARGAGPARPPGARPRPAVVRRRQQLTREQRTRLLIAVGAALVLVAVLLVPAVGYYREVLTKGSQPVARLWGEQVPLERFAKLYGYRAEQLERQIGEAQRLAASIPGGGTMMQQHIQRLQSQRNFLNDAVLNEFVQERIVAREAAARGIEVTPEDEAGWIAEEFASPAAAQPSATAGAGPTPIPTVPPEERMRNALVNGGYMTEADFRELVVRPEVQRRKLQDQMFLDVPTSEPQVHARHILVKDEETAKLVKERLAAGETFDKLAAEHSTDPGSKDKGGDLGWGGRATWVKPFSDAAFALQPGQTSDPVQSDFGWHVIQVVERDDNRALPEERRNELARERFQNWIDDKTGEGIRDGTIEFDLSDDEIAWARSYLSKQPARPRQ